MTVALNTHIRRFNNPARWHCIQVIDDNKLIIEFFFLAFEIIIARETIGIIAAVLRGWPTERTISTLASLVRTSESMDSLATT